VDLEKKQLMIRGDAINGWGGNGRARKKLDREKTPSRWVEKLVDNAKGNRSPSCSEEEGWSC